MRISDWSSDVCSSDLTVDYSRFPPSNSRAMRPSRFTSLTIVKLRTRFAVASPATLPKAGLLSPSQQKVTDCTGLHTSRACTRRTFQQNCCKRATPLQNGDGFALGGPWGDGTRIVEGKSES